MVTEGSRLADVGTDHGYIPIALRLEGVIPSALAMDINPGPLERAKEHIRQFDLETDIHTRLSDGVQALCPGEADSVLIAGMGGALTIKILEAGKDVLSSVQELILQPQSEIDKVRLYLLTHGYAITGEEMVFEDGKYYPAMRAVHGEMPLWQDVELQYGKYLLEEKHPVLQEYLKEKEKTCKKIQEKLAADGKKAEKIIVEKIVEKPVEQKLKVSLIEPNGTQPRKNFDEAALQELADSIKTYGVLQPLIVQKKDSHYEIIAGERRWRAAKLAGLTEVPVMIREYDKQKTMEIALIENVQRADLNPIEEAQAYQRLIQEFHLTQEEIAARVSKNRATVTYSMRLLKLDERVQQLLIDEKISSGHARALLGLENGERQFQTAQKIVEERLSVRDVEKLVKLLNRPEKPKKEAETGPDINLIYRQIEDKLKSIMGTKVLINRKDKNKGRIEIEYYSQEELERLIEMMESIARQ